MSFNVLVTGVGGGVGQGIIKALQLSNLNITSICGDVDLTSAGLHRNHRSIIIPKLEQCVSSPDDFLKVIGDLRLDCWLVGSEYEVAFAQANHELLMSMGVYTPKISKSLMKVANDKLDTVVWLEKHGLPFPQTVASCDSSDLDEVMEEIGYPCIVKPRHGTSAKGVVLCHNHVELTIALNRDSGQVIQKYLSGREYTCSIFKCADGTLLGPFCAARTLRAGGSWIIEVVTNQFLDQLIVSIGEKFDFEGSLNVQLIETEEGFIPIEFNSRFSGTTAVRAHFGFNEPEFYLRNYLAKERITAPVIRKGYCLRYVEEVFVEPNLSAQFGSGVLNRWF